MNKVLITLLMVLICSPVWGATQLKKTVCPSSCDYTSLEAAMNGNEQNLVTADKYFDVEISGTWSSADITSVTVHNYTTDATRYINIYTTGSARHSGKYKSDGYVLSVNGTAITVGATSMQVYIDGLQFVMSAKSGIVITMDNSASLVVVKNNIMHNGTSGNGYYGIVTSNKGVRYFYNNILVGFGGDGGGGMAGIAFYTGGGGSTVYIYNNTVDRAGIGGIYSRAIEQTNTYTTGVAVNNIIKGYSTTGWGNIYGTYVSPTDYNSTDNASLLYTVTGSGNTHDRVSQTFSFVDGTNATLTSRDYHLTSSDGGAKDFGTDLSGTFTTDIDGTTRTGTWDIGADEYVSSAPASITHTLGNITVLSGSGIISF